MVFFALFTIGYLAGVITALAIFPPRESEILEQENDALTPILSAMQEEKQVSGVEDVVGEVEAQDIGLLVNQR